MYTTDPLILRNDIHPPVFFRKVSESDHQTATTTNGGSRSSQRGPYREHGARTYIRYCVRAEPSVVMEAQAPEAEHISISMFEFSDENSIDFLCLYDIDNNLLLALLNLYL